MSQTVEGFLAECSNRKRLTAQAYRYLVLEHAGLLEDRSDYVEVTKEEYDESIKNSESGKTKYADGKYYVLKKVPVELTEEEFSAIEKELPEDVLLKMKRKTSGVKRETDWFFIALITLAAAIGLGGLILAITAALIPTNTYFNSVRMYQFELGTFLSVLLPYLLYTAICMFLADVCRKTRAYLHLVSEKQQENKTV